jgi:hypothetical protein
MKGRVRLISMTLVVIASMAFALPAQAKCQPSGRGNDGSHYWTGSARYPNATVGGVYSNILNYSPWVQPGYSDFGYSMLRTADGAKYAQVGWQEDAGGARYTFDEWTHDGTWSRDHKSAYATNSHTYYTTLWGNTPGYFTFQTAGSTWETKPAQFTPNGAEIMGEVQTSASQMPGESGNHEDFTAMNIFIGSWQAFSGDDYNSSTSWYSTSVLSTSQHQAWDKTC